MRSECDAREPSTRFPAPSCTFPHFPALSRLRLAPRLPPTAPLPAIHCTTPRFKVGSGPIGGRIGCDRCERPIGCDRRSDRIGCSGRSRPPLSAPSPRAPASPIRAAGASPAPGFEPSIWFHFAWALTGRRAPGALLSGRAARGARCALPASFAPVGLIARCQRRCPGADRFRLVPIGSDRSRPLLRTRSANSCAEYLSDPFSDAGACLGPNP